MRKSSPLLLAGSLLACSSWAQADPFVGPSISLGASLAGIQHQVSNEEIYKLFITISNGNPNMSSGNDFRASLLPVIDMNWQWQMAPKWVAGIGVEYEAGKRTSGESIVSYIPLTGSQTLTLTLKNHTAVYGTIGRKWGENWLVSGKLAYHEANAESAYRFRTTPTWMDNIQSKKVKGYGIGLGLTRNWKDGLELQFEGEYVQFANINHSITNTISDFSTKPSMTRFNAKVGYRF
ncbi:MULTISPECIES: outer membrane beta-barrel protein [unclassified Paludibacterium]|uniref:outer membrane beta-barrel protein n=1 Tax=unclassified Paludibacterium TaxID=2618429 RepID=UPI001C03C4BC|nr:outer membrane beta-barrel protein [Paludibacterium sp. B53371]BEV72521.1 hypothetical protein THUN1379_20030 [Paludibacterium sp. THUN1379]